MLISAKTGITVAACVVAGCAFKPQTTGMAVDYNKFVADATNQQTVINILRARDREPMHFTSFSKIAGQATINANAEFGASIGGNTGTKIPIDVGKAERTEFTDGATTFTPKVSVGVTTGTNFDIAINATDKFYRGILGPVSASTLVYYLRQGWRGDLLSHLFIRKIDSSATVKDELGKQIRLEFEDNSISNTPDDPDDAEAFGNAMACRTLTYRSVPSNGETLKISEVSELSGVSENLLPRLSYLTDKQTSKKLKDQSKSSKPNEKNLNYSLVKKLSGHSYNLSFSDQIDKKKCKDQKTKLFNLFESKFKEEVIINRLIKGKPLTMRDSNGKIYPVTMIDPNNGRKFPVTYTVTDPNTNEKKTITDNDAKEWTCAMPDEGKTRTNQSEKERRFLSTKQSPRRDLFQESTGQTSASADGATLASKGYFDDCLPLEYSDGNLEVDLSLRSVEGVIYYLGQYIRTNNSPEVMASNCENPSHSCQKISVPILTIKEGSDEVPADREFVKVIYKGQLYVVPSSGPNLDKLAGRSSQVISLVQQMLNLHRSAEELPSTPLVRILN